MDSRADKTQKKGKRALEFLYNVEIVCNVISEPLDLSVATEEDYSFRLVMRRNSSVPFMRLQNSCSIPHLVRVKS